MSLRGALPSMDEKQDLKEPLRSEEWSACVLCLLSPSLILKSLRISSFHLIFCPSASLRVLPHGNFVSADISISKGGKITVESGTVQSLCLVAMQSRCSYDHYLLSQTSASGPAVHPNTANFSNSLDTGRKPVHPRTRTKPG